MSSSVMIPPDAEEPEETTEPETDETTDESSGDSSCDDEPSLEKLPVRRSAFVIMTCVIGGYTLIGPLQHNLKVQIGVHDRGEAHEIFTQSVAFVQWGKTFMTLGQGVLLSCFPVVQRVYIAMVVMFCATMIPPLFVYTLGSTWLGWVPLCYGMIGLALGVFECTYLSVISPLGPLTKSWAIMGFPAAFAIVNIIGQTLMALFEMPVQVIFWYIVLCQPLAIVLFRYLAPHDSKVDGKSYTQSSIWSSLADWKSWLVKMIPFLLVNIMSHFVMESVLPAIFNTYNAHEVSLYGPTDNSVLMNKTWFLVVLSISMAVADMSSRRIGYMFELNSTQSNYVALAFALFCSSLGLYLTTLGIAILAWFSVFLAFFGAGFNYAITSRYIDRRIPRKHNLAGYSMWMFVGYCGAIAGAVLVTMVRSWICHGKAFEHQCK